jgi:protein transport protein SEC31
MVVTYKPMQDHVQAHRLIFHLIIVCYHKLTHNKKKLNIKSLETDNLLCESLLSGQYELAVDLCISENRYTDAILIASFAGKDLLTRTQERYFKNKIRNNFSRVFILFFYLNKSITNFLYNFLKFLEGYLNQDWTRIVSNCNLNHWKEALSAVLTYTNGEQLYNLCNLLGNRLENQSKLLDACICYICSSNLNQLVDCWLKVQTNNGKSKEFSSILQVLSLINLNLS